MSTGAGDFINKTTGVRSMGPMPGSVYEPQRSIESWFFTKQQRQANPLGMAVDKGILWTIIVVLFVLLIRGVPSYFRNIRDHALEPHGTGPFVRHTYGADEINKFYSLPWRHGAYVKLAGNNITVTGDLDGVHISGMGDMTFLGKIANSEILDPAGLVTVKDITNSSISANDIHVIGKAINTKRTVSGLFPKRRKYSH